MSSDLQFSDLPFRQQYCFIYLSREKHTCNTHYLIIPCCINKVYFSCVFLKSGLKHLFFSSANFFSSSVGLYKLFSGACLENSGICCMYLLFMTFLCCIDENTQLLIWVTLYLSNTNSYILWDFTCQTVFQVLLGKVPFCMSPLCLPSFMSSKSLLQLIHGIKNFKHYILFCLIHL